MVEFVEISSDDAAWLAAVATTAHEAGQSVYLAMSSSGVMVKRGGSMWTAPIGTTHKAG